MVEKYTFEIELMMKKLYDSLNERDRRRFAAFETLKLGYGGQKYVCKILGCNSEAVSHGIKELKEEQMSSDRVRQSGGGRKRFIDTIKNIDSVFLLVLKNFTAGNPMIENVLWTNLTQKEISEKMRVNGVNISVTVVKQLLKKHGYVKRKAQKKKTMKIHPDRNQQFEIIAELKEKYLNNQNPIISIDTKKKEYIGNFYREGTLYTREPIETFDHDFNSFAEGIVIPYGVYDLKQNNGFVNFGSSHDTAEFACDSVYSWWETIGKITYVDADSILILCDGGGSNSSRHHIFKEELQKLSNKTGLELRVSHYPTFCSKYNPIEHKMFPHMTRACKGVVFKSIELVKSLVDKTTTSTGLKVVTRITKKIYQTGKKITDDFKKNANIIFDKILPRWNYRIIPQKCGIIL